MNRYTPPRKIAASVIEPGFNGNGLRRIEIGIRSLNAESYMEIGVVAPQELRMGTSVQKPMHAVISADAACKLRDALIQAYPLPPAPTQVSRLTGQPRRANGPQKYAGNGEHKWEEVTVDSKGAGHTYRLRVPGGFIYRTVTTDPLEKDCIVAQSTVFVPMPDAVGYAV